MSYSNHRENVGILEIPLQIDKRGRYGILFEGN